MSDTNWIYESKYTILKASPDLKERFRALTREQLAEDYGAGHTVDETEVAEMAAFAWFVRAKEVCAKADVLIEEGVSNEEIRNIVRIEPK